MEYGIIIGGWLVSMIVYGFMTKTSNKYAYRYDDVTKFIKRGKMIDKRITKSTDDSTLF